ncbi:hypothetical protein VFPFJ_04656 [Purpureocillium lilacinum]|uniref:Uncharacterized protein n=1 Tax=Purpureocillium lilacinum TaxID=33203 RepID=A0A179HJ66_PURLI|nr:hypothetical protein VFPFJ_04656 [Purpureocillium lilacinum]OAQ90496.1 hypothetical protein VFPFJ_04656 [Purpureocillium lilacinum]
MSYRHKHTSEVFLSAVIDQIRCVAARFCGSCWTLAARGSSDATRLTFSPMLRAVAFLASHSTLTRLQLDLLFNPGYERLAYTSVEEGWALQA